MKRSLLLLRFTPVLILCMFTMPTAWSQIVESLFRIAPGRAGHSFSLLLQSGQETAILQNDGLLESPIPGESEARLTGWWDSESPFTLIDVTAGDRLELGSRGNWSGDLRTADWGTPDPQSGYWTSSGRQYFLLGPERSGHSFLAQSGASYSVVSSGGEFELLAGDGSLQMRYEFSAPAYGTDFRLIDLTTAERSPAGELTLALAAWEPISTGLPATEIYLFFDAEQIGQTFTVHSRASGGTEQLQSIIVEAFAIQSGSWHNGGMDESYLYTTDYTGTPVVIPGGVGLARATVGYGMSFWLTRSGDAASPSMVVPPFERPQWLLFGAVPPPPPPPLTETTFRIPASSGYVEHTDGSHAEFQIISTGWLYAYDDLGNVSDLTEYAMARASVDNSQGWWFVGTAGGIGADHATDVLDWQPTGHDTPPEVNASNIEVIVPLVWNNLQLVQDGWTFFLPYDTGWASTTMWNGYTFATVNYGGAQFFTSEAIDGNTGQILYSVPCVRVWLPYDANKSFHMEGSSYSTGGGGPSPVNTADLHGWFPTVHKVLSISSSRWDHELWLVQADGSESRVVQDALQGDFSIITAGQAWWNGHYQFLATVPCKEVLDWWIEDRTVSQSTPHFSAGVAPDLAGWHFVASPFGLSLVSRSPQSVSLLWSPGRAATGGSFEIESRVSNSINVGQWRVIDEIAVSDATLNWTGDVLYTALRLTTGSTYEFRVRNHFGTVHSAPSNALAVTVLSSPDTDTDGLSDDWEMLQFGDLTHNASTIEDGGTLTNKEQQDLGLNPTINEGAAQAVRKNYIYDLVGRLKSSSGAASTLGFILDFEGNITTAQ